ncbi:Serine/threonine-protein kinase Sgk2 [Coemansia aciculifera]|uniref:Serine/threonine-protein kinase Sgk2 n=1 Tax=Coemansia aciculifera TaxID=417176 RepID=A0A9W8M4D3_9FUNG|nr:Serine/threonine-protein kinase Sgk2 [Coemansia aciculifera]
MDSSANIPSALRHFLARGAGTQQQQQSNGHYNTYSPQSAASSMTTLQQVAPLQAAQTQSKLTTAKSSSNLRSGGSIGAWLSKYHLRPGGNSTSNARAPVVTPPPVAAATLAGSTSHIPQSADHALAAYITSVESRESSGSSSSTGAGELRMGGLRMGRKRFLVYRILVTGSHSTQWWVGRRYSEFHELHQALRRLFPGKAHYWGELFPSKRLIPGLSSSADSVMQRRERLNAFLRTLTHDADVCRCDTMQGFLRDQPLDIDSISLAERRAAADDIAQQSARAPAYAGIQPLMHQVAPNRRSVSSGAAMLQHSGSALYSQHRPALPESWSKGAAASQATLLHVHPPPPVQQLQPQAREQLERMASMPALKSAGARLNTYDLSAPMPALPPPGHGGFNTTRLPTQKAPISMPRKTSDPLAYATTAAEKRPSNVAPQSMRKKYGLRRNVLYRNDRIAGSASEAGAGSAPPVPDTAVTLLDPSMPGHSARASQWDDSLDYVMVDGVPSDHMDVDLTLRVASVDSAELDDDEYGSSRSKKKLGNTQVRGRNVVALRRAPLGGIEKTRRVLPVDDPAMATAKAQMRGGKRQLVTVPTSTEAVEEERVPEDDDAEAAEGREMAPSGSQKIGLDDFQLLSIIGKGSYGKVMLARYKDTGKVMAIKVISKSKLRGRPNEIRRVMSERKVLERTVRHPFLVGLQCAFQTKEKLFFCLDYVNGGELFFHLQRERRFGENRARFYAAEITSALAYLHGMDVVYRDLKPENCLLDAHGHVRIVDFGLAKDVGPVAWRTEGSALYSVEEGGKTGTFCGTPEYLAPEVLLRQRYGKEVDWYCLGAVLYEMLTGLPPYYHQDNNAMYQRILSEDLRFPSALPPPAACNGTMYAGSGNVAGNAIGRYAQDFVFRMMERDPQQRLGHGVFGTENVKRHVFFHGIDWGKIYRQEYAPPFVPKVSSIFDLSNIDPEFRNEPIPQSILMEGQVDIIAEAAEAERQAELAMQAQLMAFPSPVTSPTANRLFGERSVGRAQASTLINNESIMAALAGKRTADVDSTIDAFRGFSFVSPWVDAPDE